MPKEKTRLYGILAPHPPIIVPGLQQGEHQAQKTVSALERAADELAHAKPQTLVVITPHAPAFRDYLYLYDGPVLSGSLAAFGAPHIKLSLTQDLPLRERIIQGCLRAGLQAGAPGDREQRRYGLTRSLDHGAFVPLFFLSTGQTFEVVVLSGAGLSLDRAQLVGRIIRQAAQKLDRHIVFLASGDQSHKVNEHSPYGACPEGAQYDQALLSALQASSCQTLLSIDLMIRQEAAECGYQPLVMLCGALAHQTVRTDVFSYEAPYGIGYCVARFCVLEQADRLGPSSVPVQVARSALAGHLAQEEPALLTQLAERIRQDPLLPEQAGVFVSLRCQDRLRGCIGTIQATQKCLADEITQNAIRAATMDPRFPPLQAAELAGLSISVDVLQAPEPVDGLADLDPERFGVIVRQGRQAGLLLPGLEGIGSARQQVRVACLKGGIDPDRPYRLERFGVTRYT